MRPPLGAGNTYSLGNPDPRRGPPGGHPHGAPTMDPHHGRPETDVQDVADHQAALAAAGWRRGPRFEALEWTSAQGPYYVTLNLTGELTGKGRLAPPNGLRSL